MAQIPAMADDGTEALRFRVSREASERLHTYTAYRKMVDRRATLGTVLEELICLLPDPDLLRRDHAEAIRQAHVAALQRFADLQRAAQAPRSGAGDRTA